MSKSPIAYNSPDTSEASSSPIKSHPSHQGLPYTWQLTPHIRALPWQNPEPPLHHRPSYTSEYPLYNRGPSITSCPPLKSCQGSHSVRVSYHIEVPPLHQMPLITESPHNVTVLPSPHQRLPYTWKLSHQIRIPLIHLWSRANQALCLWNPRGTQMAPQGATEPWLRNISI